jgi:hypothetical protein
LSNTYAYRLHDFQKMPSCFLVSRFDNTRFARFSCADFFWYYIFICVGLVQNCTLSSAVSLSRPSIGFIATYDCRYDRCYRYFLSFYRLSLRSFIPNYERGRNKLSSNSFNFDFGVETFPPLDSAPKTALERMNGCL